MKFKFTGFGIALAVVVLAISGCAQVIATAEGTQPAPVIETEAPSTEAPAGKISADALPCPQDAEGMQFTADEANGYCVLVPEGFEVNRSTDMQMSFIGPVPESGVQVLGFIMVSDAEGKTAAEIAAPVISEAEGMGMNLTQQDLTVGDEPALMVDGLPGQDSNRQVFVVHGGKLFKLMFVPSDPNDPNYAQMQSLYDAVIGSMAFLR